MSNMIDIRSFITRAFHDCQGVKLFWDPSEHEYPFNLKVFWYFLKINTEYDSNEGEAIVATTVLLSIILRSNPVPDVVKGVIDHSIFR